MELLLAAFLGVMTITILDRIWWNLDHHSIEKGFEVIEHYHWGIVLIGVGIVIIDYLPLVAYFLFGAAMKLIYSEAKQKNCFAHKSNHFRNSTIIGVILCVICMILILNN